MKFDMHCHTREGSFDSKVPVVEFARRFKQLGYDGFMIADHNSYRGCKAWDQIKDRPEFNNIIAIRGLEYDTCDAGHILVIMPDDIYLPILKNRGMKCKRLIFLVHTKGGILGLAHPYGVSSSSAMGFRHMNTKLIKYMDFIEVFNTCEFPESNAAAQNLAMEYNKPGFAGSDSHVTDYIGMASMEIESEIRCNNDMIRAVKQRAEIHIDGCERDITLKAKAKENWVGKMSYTIYNRGIAKVLSPRRGYHHYMLSKPSIKEMLSQLKAEPKFH